MGIVVAFGAQFFSLCRYRGFALRRAGVFDQFDCGDGRSTGVAFGGGACANSLDNFCGGLSGAVFGLVVWGDAGEAAGGTGVISSGRGGVRAEVPVT